MGNPAANFMPSSSDDPEAPRDQLGPAQADGKLFLNRKLHDWVYATARPAQLEGLIDNAFVLDWSWHCGAAEAH